MTAHYRDIPQPRWKDAYGVVHFAGMHSQGGVWTECRIRMSGPGSRRTERYDESFDVPTCIQCAAIVDTYA